MSAGVQVNRDPPEYEFNEPTKWELANRITTSVPSPPRKTDIHCIPNDMIDTCVTFSFHIVSMFDVESSATVPLRRKYIILYSVVNVHVVSYGCILYMYNVVCIYS